MAENNQSSDFKGSTYEINDKEKWIGQELGVNSGIPLVDEGKGKPYIIRQFEFSFNPEFRLKLRDKKVAMPTKQELFNYHWRQLEAVLWGDGLVPCKEVEPRMVIGRKKYKIILLCEPRFKVLVADRPKTLQEITKPQPLVVDK